MEFRVTKQPSRFDEKLGIAYGAVNEAISKKVELIAARVYSGNGNGGNHYVYCGIVAVPNRWRVVGIGGIINVDGHDQTAEKCQWGYYYSDLGADDDAFGEVTMDDDAGDAWNTGETLYQGISPYENFFGFEPLADAEDTWDIAPPGAGTLMGVWQTKAAVLWFKKANVANSSSTVMPFYLIEYENGAGVE